MNESGRILIVDDYEAVREVHSRVLRDHGYHVETAEDGDSALRLLRKTAFDAVLSDVSMPGMSGIELAKEIRSSKIDVPVVLITGDPDLETAIEAVEFGILRYLKKPVIPRSLASVTHEVIRLHGVARAERLALDNASLRSLVDELTRAREAAQAASRAKSVFLAMMSHELRTPMTAVLGYAELVLDTDLSPEQAAAMRKVKGSAVVMLRLLQDLLTLADLAGGVSRIVLADFDVRDLIGQMTKRFGPIASGRGLPLLVEIDSHVPVSLAGDGAKFAMVVEHLLSNAVKFTEIGQISVRIDVASSTDHGVALRATVVDTGIGIPRDALMRVQDAFAQGDDSSARSHGGAGLGLAISSELARLLGGSLELESEVGVGTSARFTTQFNEPVDL